MAWNAGCNTISKTLATVDVQVEVLTSRNITSLQQAEGEESIMKHLEMVSMQH